MDISTVIAGRDYSGEPMKVHVGEGPFSIWPRLAVCPTVPETAAAHLAQKRVIRDFEFVMLVRGKGWVWWEPWQASIALVPGDVVFFVPGVTHGWASEANTHLALHFDLYARPEMRDMEMIEKEKVWAKPRPTNKVPTFRMNLAGDEVRLPLVTHVDGAEEWQAKLMPLVERYHQRTMLMGMGRLMAAEAVGWGLRRLAEESGRLLNTGGVDDRIARALALARADGGMSVRKLASSAGMGVTAFRQLFSREVGVPPRAYVEDLRLAKAKHMLLETRRPIVEVADACGYGDPYHFSRVFKRVMGESPRAFRKARGM